MLIILYSYLQQQIIQGAATLLREKVSNQINLGIFFWDMEFFMLRQFIHHMDKAFSIIICLVFIASLAIGAQGLDAQEAYTANISVQSNINGNVSIFGVRWRLGDAFSLQQENQNNEYYVLQFNSHSDSSAETYLKFQNRSFACGQQNYSSQTFSTYIHTCRINQQLVFPYDYQIIMKKIYITGLENNTHIESYQQKLLFTGKLRLQNLGASILILGDVIYDENGSFLCQVQNILKKQEISIVVIGNIYPQINEQNYVKILTLLEPITSKVMVIPAHQLPKQAELFYALSFPYSVSLTPRLYNTISFDHLNLTIFLINPVTDIFQIISSSHIQQRQKLENDFVLVVSPFQSLFQNNLFYQEISMNMYITTQNKNKYSFINSCFNKYQCRLIVTEGQVDMKNKRQDYGLLKIENKQQFKTLSFEHYSQCMPGDQFQIDYNQAKQQPVESPINNKVVRKIILAAEYIIIILLFAFLLITFLIVRKKPSKPKKSEENHVELVQQIVAGSQPPKN